MLCRICVNALGCDKAESECETKIASPVGDKSVTPNVRHNPCMQTAAAARDYTLQVILDNEKI